LSLQLSACWLYPEKQWLQVPAFNHGCRRETIEKILKTDAVTVPNGSLKESANCLKPHTVSEPWELMIRAEHIHCTIATLFILPLKVPETTTLGL
jgi:hypothetical protein